VDSAVLVDLVAEVDIEASLINRIKGEEMKFYKLTCGDNVEYTKLYDTLESLGDFIISNDVILFYANRLKKANFSKLDILIEEVDPTKYKTGNKLIDDWVCENYRKFKVENLLKKAEVEKQEELKNLYNVIRAAEDIIDRKEDLVDKE